MNIADLLQRLQDKDGTAASELVQTYYAEVFRLAFSILGDEAEAEDATQEAFIAALDALDSYRGEAAFKTWLMRIAINACRKRWRKRKATERLRRALDSTARLLGVSSAQPEEIVIRREASTALWKAVEDLSEKMQLPLILFYQHELPVAEIAELLHIPVGTVLSRLHMARVRLSKLPAVTPEVTAEAGEQ